MAETAQGSPSLRQGKLRQLLLRGELSLFRLPHWKVGKSVRRLNKFKLFTPLIFWRAGQRRSAAASCCTWVQTYRIRGPRAHTGAPRKGMRESNARPSESRPGAPTQSPRGLSARGAPHLQACLQPSSRLGSGSSPRVALPLLQLPSWPLSRPSEDQPMPTRLPVLYSGLGSGRTAG